MLTLVHRHAGELLRFARRFSLCADDAQDAYQRALEILVRRLRTQKVDNPLSYLRTIVRHEAYQVRVERERDLNRQEVDFEAAGTEPDDDPLERAERFERLAHTAEALQRLKPQELKALTLRAEGLSYREICDREGWTYTRCNRALTEGRRALLERLGAIESGAECERWLPLLSVFADGEADARSVAELRPHLRACTACRATLRELHDTTRGIRAVVPPELLLPAIVASGSGGGFGRHVEPLAHGALERIAGSAHGAFERVTGPVVRMQSAVEALSGAKIAAVAASTVAVAGCGAAIERASTESAGSRPPARVAQASPTPPPAIASQPAALTTAPAATPAALRPATALAATPEWPADADSGAGTQPPLDEFGFEGPVPRSAEGAAGTSKTASGAPPAAAHRSAAAPHGSSAAPTRSAAQHGSTAGGSAGSADATAAGSPAADPAPTQPSSPSPAASGQQSADRADPEFPAGEF